MASLRAAAAAPVSFTDENALHRRQHSKQSAASSSRARGLSAAVGSGSVSKGSAASTSSSSSRRALGDITNKDRQPAASAQLKKDKTAPAAKRSTAAAATAASSLTASRASPLPCPDIEHTLGLTFAEQCARETESESVWLQDGELSAAECQAAVRHLTSASSMKRMFETEDDRFMPYPCIEAEQEGREEAAEAVDLRQVEQLQLELNLNFDLGF